MGRRGRWRRGSAISIARTASTAAILPQMASLGLLGISVPTQYGGAGMDYIALGVASEELEYVDTSLRVIMSVHAGLNCLTLLSWGTEDQKQRYLVPQAQGRKIATYALTEPSAGSDARGIQTVAIKKGDRYVLTGEKMWISLADVADNFLVFAWSDLEKKKQRDPVGDERLHRRARVQGILERHAQGEVGHPGRATPGFFKMDEVEVPRENLVGREGEGFKIAMFALDQGRYTVAAGATGLIRACRDASVTYAKTRKTFGVEIGAHQLVKEMIAQMESDYQASRLLWLRAGWLKNVGPPQHPRDRAGQVVRDGGVGARRRRCRPDPRRQRLLRRVSCRPLLSQLQRAPSSTKARAKFTRSCRLTTCSATVRIGRHAASCRPGREAQ